MRHLSTRKLQKPKPSCQYGMMEGCLGSGCGSSPNTRALNLKPASAGGYFFLNSAVSSASDLESGILQAV